MLDTIQNVKGQSIIHEENGYRYMGALHVLYSQAPEDGEPFIELRQWCTVDGTAQELIAEWGRVDVDGELDTQAAVLPYWYGMAQALTFVNEQLAKRA